MTPRILLLQLRFVAVMVAAGIGLTALTYLIAYLTRSNLVAGFAGIVLGTGLLIAGVANEDAHNGPDAVALGMIAAMTASLAGFAGSLPLLELSRLRAAEQREVLTKELANHPGVALFRVRDGHVEAHAVQTKDHLHTEYDPDTTDHHAVAPVRPPEWRPGEPVRVWAVCEDFDTDAQQDDCLQAWHEFPGGAIVIDPDQEPCFRRTVPAEFVPPDGRLMFVHWAKSPEAYLESHWEDFFGFLRILSIISGVLTGLWVTGSLLVRAAG